MVDWATEISTLKPVIEWLVSGAAAGGASFLVLRLAARFNALGRAASSRPQAEFGGRYLPLLRLLSREDRSFLCEHPELLDRLISERHRIFRSYLRCLSQDYARLLQTIRTVMAQSNTDRPDLAKSLVRHRMLFAVAMWRIELMLTMDRFGLAAPDASALVEAFDRLREHTLTMQAAMLSVAPKAA